MIQCTSTGHGHDAIVLYRCTIHIQLECVDLSQEPVAAPYRLGRVHHALVAERVRLRHVLLHEVHEAVPRCSEWRKLETTRVQVESTVTIFTIKL